MSNTKIFAKAAYNKRLRYLQIELVKLQKWVIAERKKIVILFEGRDAAGKGGIIKRITRYLNPRYCKIIALGIPTERERTQWYFQRYVQYLPAGGEIVIFDRSWYNRAGVEHVMKFCTEKQYINFLQTCPEFEHMIISSGIQLLKYWLSISPQEQIKRFKNRIQNPTKEWKISPMDIESVNRWDDYSKAKDSMLEHTDTRYAPWYIVDSDDKKKARINCISHLLNQIKYQEITKPEITLPERISQNEYKRPSKSNYNYVPGIDFVDN